MSHVLMTTDTIGGVWTYTMELCAALERSGVEVTLVSMGRLPSADQADEVRQLGNVKLIPTAARTEWMEDCEQDLERSGAELQRIADALKPDIVHLNNYWYARLDFRAPVVVVAHSCVATWWKACRKMPLPPEWSRYMGWVREAVARADILVAPTAAFLSEFEAAHGSAIRSHVIPNGRSGFKPGVKRRIVLAAGRVWDEAKNIAMLAQIANSVDVPVIVAGDLTAPDGNVFDARGLAALGRLSTVETRRWMAEAAIFASPARYEPFGLSTLEAALSGCALILGDIPTYRELWDGVATFVDPDDAPGLRRAIRMLTDMPELAASDGAKARERALAYSAEAMGAAYLKLYRTPVLKVAA
jgi:glycosyltransferase involved in cell wall biosynthesis